MNGFPMFFTKFLQNMNLCLIDGKAAMPYNKGVDGSFRERKRA